MAVISVQRRCMILNEDALKGNQKQCTTVLVYISVHSQKQLGTVYLLSFYLVHTSESKQKLSSNHGQVITEAEYRVDLCTDWYFSWDNCLKRLMSFTVSTDGAVLAKKLLIWHFHCLSSRGERQRAPATPQGFWVTVSVGVFKTPAAASNVEYFLLLSGLETNGLFRAYFLCTCGERAERKWEALDGSVLDVFN